VKCFNGDDCVTGSCPEPCKHVPMEWGEAYDEGMALAAKMFPSTSQKERDAFATGYARQKTRTP
jgi:hypothetical protein